MAKIYSENSEKQLNNLAPKDETVKFLLNYSKALSVISYKKMKFDSILN